jgi:D-2-hydroxyacid dehydrogenase (NADP+)
MSTTIVRHDLPVAEALAETREELDVIEAGTTDEVIEYLSTADSLVINPSSWDDSILNSLDENDWVQATSTGYSAFPVDEFDKRGITFTNATGNYGTPVADHSFALILGLARKIPDFVVAQTEQVWDRSIGSELMDLKNRTLTIVGMGDIGESVAQRGQAFGMSVYGTKRDTSAYDGCLSSDHILSADELHTVVDKTEVLVLTVPLTDTTHHLVDREIFDLLPETALLINVARGPVVDQGALINAIENNKIAGAGLDVFDSEPLPESSPLWDLENVIITPHVAGRTDSFVDRFVSLYLHNYDRRKAAEPMKNVVVR